MAKITPATDPRKATARRRVDRGTARARLLDAAIDVIRLQGYAATTVDDLCAAAGVTKGAFFHHFDTKADLAIAAADYWSTTTGDRFADAAYHRAPTPTERVLGYVRFRAELIDGPPAAFTCLVGTMTQEVFATDPAIRDACAASIFGHAERLETDIDAALTDDARADSVTAGSVARHSQAVLQGSFVLAKAADDPAIVIDNLDHLTRYLTTILQPINGRSNSSAEANEGTPIPDAAISTDPLRNGTSTSDHLRPTAPTSGSGSWSAAGSDSVRRVLWASRRMAPASVIR